ncbi:MAG: helix-turn-helix transcriptional regulator [Candidatus Omnitrophota bacterium]
MSAKGDWLWDRKIGVQAAKTILKNPADRHFLSLAGLLLSRKNTPQEVLKGYLEPRIFLANWQDIKRQMRKDEWNNPRIEFWQAVYEKLKEKYEKKGVFVERKRAEKRLPDGFLQELAGKIRNARIKKGLTQSDLAKKLRISQQVISRIESGRENISLLTLKKIVDSLGSELHLEVIS